MVGAAPNPTQLTPPRVAFIDDRTGAISREWYRFFLSLFTATKDAQSAADLTPDVSALLASFDAWAQDAVQAAASAPDSTTAIASMASRLDKLEHATKVNPASVTPGELAKINADLRALALTPPPKQFLTPRYGSFYDTTTQTAAAINTAYAITYNTTDLSQGVRIGTPTSRVYVDRPNVYNIQFSAQLDKTSGGVALFWIWLRKNGTDVANSATQIRIQGNDAETVAAWNFLLQLNAGDYFELMWAVADTSVQISASAAAAPVPAIPSIILTVTDNVSSLEV